MGKNSFHFLYFSSFLLDKKLVKGCVQ